MSIGSASIGEFAIGETPSAGATTFNETLAETLSLVGAITGDTTGVLLPDTLSLTDVLTDSAGVLLKEVIRLNETTSTDLILNRTFTEPLRFTDDLKMAYAALLADSLVFTDTVSFVRAWISKLQEQFNFGDTATGVSTYGKLVSSALAFADLAAHWEYETLSDSLVLEDTLAGLTTLYDALVESIVLGDTSSYIAVFTGSVSDNVAFADTLSPQATFQALLADEFRFVIWEGHDQVAYTGLVMNPRVGGLTEYVNYNFNSITKIGSSYYGASSTGIYLLEGANDAGTEIAARVKFGAFDFGAGKKSRVEQAYIGVRSDGKIVIKTFADDGKERWYETQALHGDLNTQRAKLGRGVTSRYWQFELINRNGAPLEVEQIEFLPIVLTRRV